MKLAAVNSTSAFTGGLPTRATHWAFAALWFTLALAGAVHAGKPDLDYERLRGSLNELRNDPALGSLAPAEIALADQALATLAAQGGKSKLHDHLVFIVERRIDIAYAAARTAEQESKLQQLDREHDQILLAASRRDAEQARRDLEKQRIQSLADAEEAQRLRAEADAARAQSEQTSQEAETARAQAAQARKLADAQAREAELARKETQLLEASGAKPAAKGKKAAAAPITLGAAAFAPGQAELRPGAQAQIARIVAAAGNRYAIRIEAHADDGGSAKGNLALSQQRARAVRDALIAAGIDGRRISAHGVGGKGGNSRQVVVSFSQH